MGCRKTPRSPCNDHPPSAQGMPVGYCETPVPAPTIEGVVGPYVVWVNNPSTQLSVVVTVRATHLPPRLRPTPPFTPAHTSVHTCTLLRSNLHTPPFTPAHTPSSHTHSHFPAHLRFHPHLTPPFTPRPHLVHTHALEAEDGGKATHLLTTNCLPWGVSHPLSHLHVHPIHTANTPHSHRMHLHSQAEDGGKATYLLTVQCVPCGFAVAAPPVPNASPPIASSSMWLLLLLAPCSAWWERQHETPEEVWLRLAEKKTDTRAGRASPAAGCVVLSHAKKKTRF